MGRLQAYLKRVGIPFVTTPQFVVNGQPQFSESSSVWIGQTPDSRTFSLTGQPEISVQMAENSVVQTNIGPANLSIRSSVSLVRYTRSLSTRVTSGDNNGRELKNASVVRELRSVALYVGLPLTLKVPVPSYDLSSDTIAVILHEIDPGPIIAATLLRRQFEAGP